MSNKSKYGVLITITVVSLIIFLVLHFGFGKCYYELFYELLLTTFTGIVFIIPTHILNLYRDNRDTNNICFSLLCKLQNDLNGIVLTTSLNNIIETNERHRKNIVKYHNELTNLRKNYYIVNESQFDDLLDNIFKISILVKETNKLLQSSNNSTNVSMKFNTIKEMRNGSIENIEKIKSRL